VATHKTTVDIGYSEGTDIGYSESTDIGNSEDADIGYTESTDIGYSEGTAAPSRLLLVFGRGDPEVKSSIILVRDWSIALPALTSVPV
jgi:hypothetical protein